MSGHEHQRPWWGVYELGVDEARRRVDKITDEIGGQLNLSSSWDGDHLRVKGVGVKGRILVAHDSVEVHVHLGLTMLIMREPIRSAIENSIDHYID